MNEARLLHNLNLLENEEVQLIARHYLLTYWWKIFLAIILVLLSFFLLYPLLQWEWFGPIIFCLLLALAIWAATRLFFGWYYSCLILTNRRLIDFDQRGLLSREVTETFLPQVEDLNYRRHGLFGSIFNYGSIFYSFQPGQTKIVFARVKNPQFIFQRISSFTEIEKPASAASVSGVVDTAEKLTHLLKNMKAELGEETFKSLVRQVLVDKKPGEK